MSVFTGLAQRTHVHVDKPVHTSNPRPSKETLKDRVSEGNITESILWENVHIPSQWSDLRCCLWWEGTPERGVTDHWDTMPWGGPAVQNTPIHQHSHHSNPVYSPLSWLHEKSLLLLCWKTDDSESHTYSHIQTFVQTPTCINTNIYEHNIHTEGVAQRAKLLVLPPMEWITLVVCIEDHRYVQMEMILSSWTTPGPHTGPVTTTRHG